MDKGNEKGIFLFEKISRNVLVASYDPGKWKLRISLNQIFHILLVKNLQKPYGWLV